MTGNVNDIRNVENNFVNSLGNGKKAVEHLASLMGAVVSSRDTTIITRIMRRAHTKDDTGAISAIRLTVGQVFPGANLKLDKKTGEYTLKIKGVSADDDAMKRLNEAVERGLSLRHATFRSLIKADVKEEKPFDPKAWAERTTKAHPDQIEAMIAALQALRPGKAA